MSQKYSRMVKYRLVCWDIGTKVKVEHCSKVQKHCGGIPSTFQSIHALGIVTADTAGQKEEIFIDLDLDDLDYDSYPSDPPPPKSIFTASSEPSSFLPGE